MLLVVIVDSRNHYNSNHKNNIILYTADFYKSNSNILYNKEYTIVNHNNCNYNNANIDSIININNVSNNIYYNHNNNNINNNI